MKLAYFDCIGGASGDMLLAALVDAGAAEETLAQAIQALNLPGCTLAFTRVMKGALSALQAQVTTPPQPEHRHLGDLLAILNAAELPIAIQNQADRILRRLGQVEAEIHNTPLEEVHLHELGGDDTLIDIVGVLAGLCDLGIEQSIVSPLPLGRGWTKSVHGQLPLPAPATLALLKGVPIQPVEIEMETVTPTGAALLTGIATRFGNFPLMTLRRVGCGAGRRDLPFPNVIRLWVGETQSTTIEQTMEGGLIVETLNVIETNIDDMNPQIYGHLMERLLALGVLDVTLSALQMKKNRPATLLSVLCRSEQVVGVMDVLFSETTTLGLRKQTVERICLPRRTATVQTVYGPIRVKITRWQDRERCMPEYEDCRQAAGKYGVPIAEVMQAAKTVRLADVAGHAE